jgi:hypothetical protein
MYKNKEYVLGGPQVRVCGKLIVDNDLELATAAKNISAENTVSGSLLVSGETQFQKCQVLEDMVVQGSTTVGENLVVDGIDVAKRLDYFCLSSGPLGDEAWYQNDTIAFGLVDLQTSRKNNAPYTTVQLGKNFSQGNGVSDTSIIKCLSTGEYEVEWSGLYRNNGSSGNLLQILITEGPNFGVADSVLKTRLYASNLTDVNPIHFYYQFHMKSTVNLTEGKEYRFYARPYSSPAALSFVNYATPFTITLKKLNSNFIIL